MRKIDVILGKNDVMRISEALKRLGIGGLTVSKIRGRGKNPGPEVHASKGSEIFIPQFSQKYRVTVIIPESKEDEVIKSIRENSRVGKIFVTEVLRAIDIESGEEGEKTI